MAVPEICVWWIPQVPMCMFTYDVPTIDAGIMLCDALAKYDLFQYENKVKPDYCSTGGVMWKHPEATEGEWEDIEIDDEHDVAYVRAILAEHTGG